MKKIIFYTVLTLILSTAAMAKNVNMDDVQKPLKKAGFVFGDLSDKDNLYAEHKTGLVDFRTDEHSEIGGIIFFLYLDYKNQKDIENSVATLFAPFIQDKESVKAWVGECLQDTTQTKRLKIGHMDLSCMPALGNDFYISAFKEDYNACLQRNERKCKHLIKE